MTIHMKNIGNIVVADLREASCSPTTNPGPWLKRFFGGRAFQEKSVYLLFKQTPSSKLHKIHNLTLSDVHTAIRKWLRLRSIHTRQGGKMVWQSRKIIDLIVTRLLIGSQKLKPTSDKKIGITVLLYIYK